MSAVGEGRQLAGEELLAWMGCSVEGACKLSPHQLRQSVTDRWSERRMIVVMARLGSVSAAARD